LQELPAAARNPEQANDVVRYEANKRSWRHNEFRARTIREYFGGKIFREISPLLVEKFKRDRRESITARQAVRS